MIHTRSGSSSFVLISTPAMKRGSLSLDALLPREPPSSMRRDRPRRSTGRLGTGRTCNQRLYVDDRGEVSSFHRRAGAPTATRSPTHDRGGGRSPADWPAAAGPGPRCSLDQSRRTDARYKVRKGRTMVVRWRRTPARSAGHLLQDPQIAGLVWRSNEPPVHPRKVGSFLHCRPDVTHLNGRGDIRRYQRHFRRWRAASEGLTALVAVSTMCARGRCRSMIE